MMGYTQNRGKNGFSKEELNDLLFNSFIVGRETQKKKNRPLYETGGNKQGANLFGEDSSLGYKQRTPEAGAKSVVSLAELKQALGNEMAPYQNRKAINIEFAPYNKGGGAENGSFSKEDLNDLLFNSFVVGKEVQKKKNRPLYEANSREDLSSRRVANSILESVLSGGYRSKEAASENYSPQNRISSGHNGGQHSIGMLGNPVGEIKLYGDNEITHKPYEYNVSFNGSTLPMKVPLNLKEGSQLISLEAGNATKDMFKKKEEVKDNKIYKEHDKATAANFYGNTLDTVDQTEMEPDRIVINSNPLGILNLLDRVNNIDTEVAKKIFSKDEGENDKSFFESYKSEIMDITKLQNIGNDLENLGFYLTKSDKKELRSIVSSPFVDRSEIEIDRERLQLIKKIKEIVDKNIAIQEKTGIQNADLKYLSEKLSDMEEEATTRYPYEAIKKNKEMEEKEFVDSVTSLIAEEASKKGRYESDPYPNINQNQYEWNEKLFNYFIPYLDIRDANAIEAKINYQKRYFDDYYKNTYSISQQLDNISSPEEFASIEEMMLERDRQFLEYIENNIPGVRGAAFVGDTLWVLPYGKGEKAVMVDEGFLEMLKNVLVSSSGKIATSATLASVGEKYAKKLAKNANSPAKLALGVFLFSMLGSSLGTSAGSTIDTLRAAIVTRNRVNAKLLKKSALNGLESGLENAPYDFVIGKGLKVILSRPAKFIKNKIGQFVNRIEEHALNNISERYNYPRVSTYISPMYTDYVLNAKKRSI